MRTRLDITLTTAGSDTARRTELEMKPSRRLTPLTIYVCSLYWPFWGAPLICCLLSEFIIIGLCRNICIAFSTDEPTICHHLSCHIIDSNKPWPYILYSESPSGPLQLLTSFSYRESGHPLPIIINESTNEVWLSLTQFS